MMLYDAERGVKRTWRFTRGIFPLFFPIGAVGGRTVMQHEEQKDLAFLNERFLFFWPCGWFSLPPFLRQLFSGMVGMVGIFYKKGLVLATFFPQARGQLDFFFL